MGKKKTVVSSIVVIQKPLSHILNKHPSFTQEHTDGSINQQGLASAFVVPSLDAKQSFRLSHPSSPTAAKLSAILEQGCASGHHLEVVPKYHIEKVTRHTRGLVQLKIYKRLTIVHCKLAKKLCEAQNSIP